MAKAKAKTPSDAQAVKNSYTPINKDLNSWNDFFRQSAEGSIDYGQGNPFSQAAQGYITQMLGGDMSSNPWMTNLYNNVSGVNMNEGMDMLRGFIGNPNTGPTGGPRKSTPRGSVAGSGYYQGGTYHAGGAGGGPLNPGGIPDSTVGSGVFSQHINDILSSSHLDPANDPTMQPMTQALQQDAEESYYRGLQDLQAQLEGAGQFGGSMYAGMMSKARDDYNENIQNTLAAQYSHARDVALRNQMEALSLVNNRDIASAQIAAQKQAAADAAGAQAAAIAEQAREFDRQIQLSGINSMLQAEQFGVGMQGQMAQLMQGGQLGALQAGQGYGNLGMSGYQTAQGFGQLGLGSLQQLTQNQNSAWEVIQNQRAQQMAQEQANRQWQQYQDQLPFQDLSNMINLMQGLGNISGDGLTAPYVPNAQQPTNINDWGQGIGSILAGLGNYFGTNNSGRQGNG